MSTRGRGNSFRPRRGFSSRGHGTFSERRSSDYHSSAQYSNVPRRSRDFDSSFRHKSEIDITKALVFSALESRGPRRMRSNFKQHSRPYEEFDHDRKKYNFKDSDRSMREPRHPSESRRYSKEHRDEHFSRTSNISKDTFKYVDRKHFDDDYSASSMKRQRMNDGSYRESKFYMDRDSKLSMDRGSKFPIHRDSKYSFQRESRPGYKPFQRFTPKFSHSHRGRGGPKSDHHRFSIKNSGRLNFNSERMLPFSRKRSSSRDNGMPMKVTIKSSGRRQVGEDSLHSHGGDHVELKCPHCPSYEAFTFKEYRYHLDSKTHGSNLSKLIRKHSAVLRKIRLQQRDAQRDEEEAMNKEDPEKFRSAPKEFCGICKLVYKVFNSDAQAEHDDSRYHKLQVQYLRPYCKLCKIKLPSLMVYEHHTASIRHLRSICESKIEHSDEVEQDNQDEKEEFDMSNFVTMDAVGEDDNTSMSDNEEITGRPEEVEAAIEETKDDYEITHNSELDDTTMDREDLKFEPKSEPAEQDDTVDEGLELLVEDYHSDDELILADEPVGNEYLCDIEAMLCRLCGIAVRIDLIGAEALDKHCRSIDHINRFNDMEIKSNNSNESNHSNNGTVETPDVEKIDSPSPTNLTGSPSQSGDEQDEDKE